MQYQEHNPVRSKESGQEECIVVESRLAYGRGTVITTACVDEGRILLQEYAPEQPDSNKLLVLTTQEGIERLAAFLAARATSHISPATT